MQGAFGVPRGEDLARQASATGALSAFADKPEDGAARAGNGEAGKGGGAKGGKGFGGGEATRDPEPTEVDPNDPKGKQQAIHKAESFAEYLAKRSAGQ